MDFLEKLKRFNYWILIILAIVIWFNSEIDERLSFYADNSTKYFQAYSVIENQFQDDKIRCKWLEEFDFCKYHIVTNTMIKIPEGYRGAFPVVLSYVNAIVIKYLGTPFFIWYPQILFLVMLFLIYILYKNIYIPLLLFFCTPLFFIFITYNDVSLNIFFYSFIFVFLHLKERLKGYQIVILGMITGLNIFFRYEGDIFIGLLLFFLVLFDKKNRKVYLLYILGFVITTMIFFIMNVNYYGNILGNRFDFNKELILNWDIKYRLKVLKGNLWGIEIHPIGYFKYMPYFLVMYVVFWFDRKRYSMMERIIYVTVMLSMIVILFLSPNDAKVDYGTRYLSVLIIPSIFLLKRSMEEKKSKVYRFMMILLLLVSFNYSLKYGSDLVKIFSNGQELYHSIKEDFRKDTLWIFFNHYSPTVFGTYIYENKVILITSIEDAQSFVKLLIEKKLLNKYKKILISNLNINFDKLPKNLHKVYYEIFHENPSVVEKILEDLKSYSKEYNVQRVQYDRNTDIKFHYYYISYFN